MKPLTIKPVSQQSQPDNSKISIDMAEQIADRAARRAADETATRVSQENRDNMESFNRFQEQNKKPLETEQPEYVEEDPGVDLFDKTTATSISKTMRAVKAMQEFLAPPPDPIRMAMENGISQMASRFVENTLLGGGGAGVAAKKTSFLIDVLNTAAAHGFGESLGGNLPNVIQSLTGVIGQQKAQELASAATKAMSQQQTETVESGNSDSSNVEKQKDMVLALDINNPEHISQYASAMGLSEKAAKGMLQIHQDDILTERKNLNGGANANVGNSEISQALGIIIQEMTGMKQTISNLQTEIVSIKGKKDSVGDEDVETPQFDDKWSDDDKPPQIEVTKSPIGAPQKSVTLFSTPIKVDLDEIKGDTNAFFNDKPTSLNKSEKEEENVLEEVVDSEGKSTFRMSNEKEQPKNVIEKDIEKKVEKSIEKSINKPIDKPIEKEDDKKKENNVESVKLDDLGDLEKVDPESIDESPQTEEVLQPEEASQPKEKPHRRRLIRKSIPIKEDLPSHVTERYDIDNNLMI